MECCKLPPKMPSKTGVSRAEIAAHAFECSVGSGVASEQFKAQDGRRLELLGPSPVPASPIAPPFKVGICGPLDRWFGPRTLAFGCVF
jgi:hypothetical protein